MAIRDVRSTWSSGSSRVGPGRCTYEIASLRSSIHEQTEETLAERLRPMGFPRAGSNPTGVASTVVRAWHAAPVRLPEPSSAAHMEVDSDGEHEVLQLSWRYVEQLSADTWTAAAGQ